MNGDSCNIIPQSRTASGEQKDSPLFLEISELVKGDRNKAVSLYQKATSAEVKDQVNSLPKEIVNFYEDSFDDEGNPTPTLATVFNVSDMAKDIDMDELKDYLIRTTDTSIDKIEDFQKIKDFNEGEWSTFFKAVKTDYTKMQGSFTIVPVKDDSPDWGATNDSFQATILEGLDPVFKSLGLYSQTLNNAFSKFRKLRPTYYGEEIYDVMVNLLKFAEGDTPRFGEPRYYEMAVMITTIMQNNPFLDRVIKLLRKDDFYKTVVEDDTLSDEDRLNTALYIVIAGIIKKETPKYQRPNVLTKRVLDLLRQFKTKVNEAASKNDKCTSKWAIDNLYKVNDKYTVINDDFLRRHPIIRTAEAASSVTQQAKVALTKIQEHVLKYLQLIRNATNDDERETEGLQDLRFSWRAELRHLSTLDRNITGFTMSDNPEFQEIFDAINRLVLLLESNWNVINDLTETLGQSSQAELFSNNLLCGKYKALLYTIQESEKILKTLKDLRTFEQQKGEKGEQKFFDDAFYKRILTVEADIRQRRDVVEKSMREAVINELMKIFPHTRFTLPNGRKVSVREWIETSGDNIPFDITGMERQLTSVSEMSNPLLGLLDAYKNRIQQAGRQEALRVKDEILSVQNNLSNRDTSWMFRTKVDDEGRETLTGKYIMDYDRDAFAEDYKKFLDKVRAANNLSQEAKQEAIRNWFMEHTEVREDLDGYRHPNRKYYYNSRFDTLTDSQKHYWEVFMKAKSDIVSSFPNLHYALDDAILVRKDNRELIKDSTKKRGFKGFWQALGNILYHTWKETSDEREYGVEEYVHKDFEDNMIYSLPMYYHTLYDNETMDDISLNTTDALINYAEIMTNSAALKNVINILDTAADVIANQQYQTRGVKQVEVLSEGAYSTRKVTPVIPSELKSLAVYKDWLRAQCYGKFNKNNTSKRLRLVANGYMKLVSFWTLALNTTSAVSNILQGLAQIIPTAIGGYFFNIKDLTKACALYDKQLLPWHGESFIADIGSTTKSNALNLFSRKFTIMQDYSEGMRETNSKRSRIGRLMSSNALYFLLHAGEHYLQHRGAFATMYNEKNLLTDANGNKVAAFDAYDYVWINPFKHSSGKKMVLKRGMTANINGDRKLIITNEELRERAEEYALEKDRARATEILYKKLAKYGNVEVDGTELRSTQEIDSFLEKATAEELKHVVPNLTNSHNIDKSLLKENEVAEDEWVSSLSRKMAAINHYMHGIYNKEDQASAQYLTVATICFMYRKYLVPAINRRYGKSHYIAALDANFEGYYTSTFKFTAELAKELHAIVGGNISRKTNGRWFKDADYTKSFYHLNEDQKSIVRDFLDLNGITYIDNQDIENIWSTYDRRTRAEILFGETNAFRIALDRMDDMQKANLRQALAETGLFFNLVIANLLLDFDDDDDDSLPMAALKFFLRRLQTEIGALNPLSLVLIAFKLADKKDSPELHALGSQNMVSEFLQLLNQPIVGMNATQDFMNVLSLFNIKTYENEIGQGKFADKSEAYRILYQYTPLKQFDDWSVESFHEKEAWYKK